MIFEIVPVPGHEKYYGVSDDGKVFSFNYKNTGQTRELKQSDHEWGYKTVTAKRIRSAKIYVHRLIAMTFVPNPLNLPQVNHIDGNKKNNSKSNLEWVNQSENHRHAFRTGLRSGKKGEDHFNHKLTNENVAEIRRELGGPSSYHGQMADIARRYGVTPSCIFGIKSGKERAEVTSGGQK